MDTRAESIRSHADAVLGFVDALVQLPGYAPFDTTFSFERRSLAADDFLQALESELAARGYGLRTTTTLGSERAVGHVVERQDDGQVTRTIAFGPVQMRRRFAPSAGGTWEPVSSLFIRGADASRVTLGEQGAAARRALETPAAVDTDTPDAVVRPADSVSPVETDEAEPGVVARGVQRRDAARLQDAPIAGASPAPGSASASSGTTNSPGLSSDELPIPRNVADIGGSNYAGVFESYANVDELILVFPNDSMVLGTDNKRQIQAAVARADPERDLFSIIGCSFGSTSLENGNEVLATGRANRVKEALIVAGVPGERVLDEGCWAGAPAENFPGRGVVLTIKRPIGTLE